MIIKYKTFEVVQCPLLNLFLPDSSLNYDKESLYIYVLDMGMVATGDCDRESL